MSQEADRQIFWADGQFKPCQYVHTNFITGVQHAKVNTGLHLVGATAKIEVDAVLLGTSGDWNFLVMGESADNSNDCIKIRRCWNGDSKTIHANKTENQTFDLTVGVPFHAVLDRYAFSIDGISKSLSWASTTTSPDIYIGGGYWGPSNDNLSTRAWDGAVGEVKLYDDGELVGHFTPGYSNAERRYGFWDYVTGKFFGSCTSTDFTEWSVSS